MRFGEPFDCATFPNALDALVHLHPHVGVARARVLQQFGCGGHGLAISVINALS